MMMADENGEHGIHGAPAGVRGTEVGTRHQEKLEEFRERESDIRDLEPYTEHERALRDEDAQAKAYMEAWDHYQCAYNAVHHRQAADDLEQKISDLIDAIIGAEAGWTSKIEFARVVWAAGQERARLFGMIEQAQATAENLAENLNRSLGYMEALKEVAEWVGASTKDVTASELVVAIKASVVNPRKRESFQ
jgi:DNA repair exonuclease SbcCD ATPase subunit